MTSNDEIQDFLAPMSSLAKWNPLDDDPWDLSSPITREEIQAAIDAGTLEARASDSLGYTYWSRKSEAAMRAFHIQRIAFFVVNSWTDPIRLDIGVPALDYYRSWPPTDGNHRLAAAFFRGDATILTSLTGQIDYAEHLGILPKAS